MIIKIHKVADLNRIKVVVPVSVYQEALRTLSILEEAYGETDGGYVAICDTKAEVQECLEERNAVDMLMEWEKILDNGYRSQLCLLSDDYALVLIFPT